MVKDKVEICEINLSRFNSIQGIGQFPLFSKARYAALAEIISREIEEEFQHFISQPIEEGDKITWYSIPFKENPVRFTELSQNEIKQYQKIKHETLKTYEKALDNLKSKGKVDDYEYLEKCLKYIIDDFLYCFDGKIVLCVWGMKPKKNDDGNYGEYVLDIFNSSNKNIKYSITFNSGSNGKIQDETIISFELEKGAIFNQKNIPTVISNKGYKFKGWDDDVFLNGEPIKKDKIINAIYIKEEVEDIPLPPLPEVEETKKEEETIINHTVFFKFFTSEGEIKHEKIIRPDGYRITEKDIPLIENKEGFTFSGWDYEPINKKVNNNLSFEGHYIKDKRIPWYIRFWNWLKAFFLKNKFLKWLLWLLLIILLIILFSWLLRGCNNVKPIPSPIIEKPWVNNDPRVGDNGGIYDPGNPYITVPTPPEFKDILPPNQGVMPPIDTTKIIRDPGTPVIMSNRLNILLENQDKSIIDLAKDFKKKYPDKKYKIVYYDDVVKRMQIEIPVNERIKLKSEIPRNFAPEYEIFIFDESLFECSYTPKDPAYSDPNNSWYLKAINAPLAWDLSLGSPKVTIAIIDNGFNLNHPELKSKVVMPYNVWLHSTEVFPQQVDHGTHVAGTALAIANNGKGLCGIAPNCAFMPVQVANEEDFITTSSILDGILYSLYQGADVINVSIGMAFTGSLPKDKQRDLQNNHYKEEERLWNKVMEISNKHKAIIVVAAGNDNVLAGINPMNRPKNFIIVSALDKNNNLYQKAGFSNYGDYSTISAPGVGIFSTVGKNSYQLMDGTSMAAPIVTGSVALMKSLNKELNSEQITCILKSSGKPINGNIGNLIQIDKALKRVKSNDFTNCDYRPETPSTGDIQILLSWDNYNDLDIVCTDPNNETIWFRNKSVTSGGKLEIDMNVNYPDNKKPLENIFWPQETAPDGTYKVTLLYYKKHINIDETNYKIVVKYGDKIEAYKGKIKFNDNFIQICSFTLGDTSPNIPSSPSNDNRRRESLLLERDELQKKIDKINLELKRN